MIAAFTNKEAVQGERQGDGVVRSRQQSAAVLGRKFCQPCARMLKQPLPRLQYIRVHCHQLTPHFRRLKVDYRMVR